MSYSGWYINVDREQVLVTGLYDQKMLAEHLKTAPAQISKI